MRTIKIFAPNGSVYYGSPTDDNIYPSIWLSLDEPFKEKGGYVKDCYVYNLCFNSETGADDSSYLNGTDPFTINVNDIPRLNEMAFLRPDDRDEMILYLDTEIFNKAKSRNV